VILSPIPELDPVTSTARRESPSSASAAGVESADTQKMVTMMSIRDRAIAVFLAFWGYWKYNLTSLCQR
jgi:hypothetical protein